MMEALLFNRPHFRFFLIRGQMEGQEHVQWLDLAETSGKSMSNLKIVRKSVSHHQNGINE